MLVLSRKRNEKIIIGSGENKIEIMIVDIKGDKVRLGIQAKAEIPIHREEVWNIIQKENESKDTIEPIR